MAEAKYIQVPTGHIIIMDGERGRLECLSLGDYGKDVNIKADFLGLSREPSSVRHTELLPLEEKWVITISTQYGCSMGCKFCDVPKVGPGINASTDDMLNQLRVARWLHPEIERCQHMNIHFARMGEPSWNPSVLNAAIEFRGAWGFNVHPVVSTMMPRGNKRLREFIHRWMDIKNRCYEGNAGLQLSINSTDERERAEMFNGNALTIAEIAEVMRGIRPIGRKITLNFAVADWAISPEVLRGHFDPQDYIVKLTPMHKTNAALKNGIRTEGEYTSYHPYQQHERALREAGYDVLVFIASDEEDQSRITCGNAILNSSQTQLAL